MQNQKRVSANFQVNDYCLLALQGNTIITIKGVSHLSLVMRGDILTTRLLTKTKRSNCLLQK